MKLTTEEAMALASIAEWFKTDPEKLIHKMLGYQIAYIQEIMDNCWKEQCNIQKYELARRYKILE